MHAMSFCGKDDTDWDFNELQKSMISTQKIAAATASSGAGEMMRHANLGASMASAGLLAKREAIEDE